MNQLKRHIILLAAAFLSFSILYPQESPSVKFEKGVKFYSEANYQAALDTWIEIFNTGYRSAALNYNIGNAYFKLNNTPGAILFFERAHLLKPADENIKYNLQIARTMVADKFEEIPEVFFVRWFDFLSLLLTTNKWAMISIVTFIFFLLFLSVYFYSSLYRLKVISFWTALFFFLVSASSLSFTLRNRAIVYDSREAIIFAPSVHGKSSPDNSGTDLFILHEGSKVSVEDEVGQWYEIKLSDGNKGWVPSDCLNII